MRKVGIYSLTKLINHFINQRVFYDCLLKNIKIGFRFIHPQNIPCRYKLCCKAIRSNYDWYKKLKKFVNTPKSGD